MNAALEKTLLHRIASLPDAEPLAVLHSNTLGSLGVSEETHALAEAAVMLALSRKLTRHLLAGDASTKQPPPGRRELFQTALQEVEVLAKSHGEHIYLTCSNALRELFDEVEQGRIPDERTRDLATSSDAESDAGSEASWPFERLAERLAAPTPTERRIVQRTLMCPTGEYRTDRANAFVETERLRCLGHYPEPGDEDSEDGWTEEVVEAWKRSHLTLEDVAHIVYDDVHVLTMQFPVDDTIWLSKDYLDEHAEHHPYPATREEALATRKIGVFHERDGYVVDLADDYDVEYVLVTPDLVRIAKLIDAEAKRMDAEEDTDSDA